MAASPAAAGAKKTAAAHPPTIDMIVEAIKTLKERGGSSLYAIKKFIGEAHKLDMDKYGNNVKRALKHGVETGTLTQTKGTGASGSFKLGDKKGAVEKKKAPAAKKPKSTTKKVTAKKTSKPKAEESKAKPAAAAEKKPKKKTKAPKKATKAE